MPSAAQMGDIVKHEEGTTARASPHVGFHHAGFAFSPGFTGNQETKKPFQVFLGVVVIQFQGTGWIHFTLHQLLDLDQPKLLEGKRRIGHIAGGRTGYAEIPRPTDREHVLETHCLR